MGTTKVGKPQVVTPRVPRVSCSLSYISRCKEMRVTVKKSNISSYGRVRWEVSINGKPVIMVRHENGEVWFTWCDKDFDICTVKMLSGSPLYETKALFKALSYTL